MTGRMGALLTLAVLMTTATAQQNITLMKDVYGAVDPVNSMSPRWQTAFERAGVTKHFEALRTAENCVFPIDIVIVQDTTSSFDDDFDNMATTQLGLMETALTQSHPGSRVGVVSFRDIPIWSLGEPATDYCQHIDLPLTSDFAAVKALYTKLQSIGGGDPPENQFGALLAAAMSSEFEWTENPDASRLIVVVTDAAPHFDADGANVYGLKSNTGSYEAATAQADCTTYYYPSPDQVRDALLRAKAYLGALVHDSQYDQYQPRDSWKWMNGYLGQLPEFYHDINEDSGNFWEVLSSIVTTLENVECAAPAITTTLAPTTPEPTATPVGTVIVPPVSDLPPSCDVCPNPCPPEGCDPCCTDGVLIKLRHRPLRLRLEIENPSPATL